MKTTNYRPAFRYKRHLYILQRIFITTNLIAISLYLLLRVIFYDLPFEWKTELMQVLGAVTTASLVAVGVSFVAFATDALLFLFRRAKHATPRVLLQNNDYTKAAKARQWPGPYRSALQNTMAGAAHTRQ